jgi:hypothetical protein
MSEDGTTALIELRGIDGSIRDYAIIDAADAEWASQWRWGLDGQGYAARNDGLRPHRRYAYLHRELLGLPRIGDGRQGDHIDRVRLNNRRSNLRILTSHTNPQNTTSRKHSSVYRGVAWDPLRGKWTAQIQHQGKYTHLGRFATEEEAAEVARAARARILPFATD